MSSHKSAAKYCLPKPGVCRSRSKSSGFTLIEMLIVLVIIGILAAILFPVFARVRENGRRTACTSNLKQLGLAFQMYTQDNNNKLPLAVDGTWGENEPYAWTFYSKKGSTDPNADPDVPPQFDPTRGSIYQYAKSDAVFICPSDDDGIDTKQSYAVNSCVFFRDTPGDYKNLSNQAGSDAGSLRRGKSLVRFRNPSEWMLIGEESRFANEPINSSTDDAYLNLKDSTQSDAYQNHFSLRHSEGSVIAFMDGHAKWYTQENILANRFQIGGPNSAGTLANGCPAGVN